MGLGAHYQFTICVCHSVSSNGRSKQFLPGTSTGQAASCQRRSGDLVLIKLIQNRYYRFDELDPISNDRFLHCNTVDFLISFALYLLATYDKSVYSIYKKMLTLPRFAPIYSYHLFLDLEFSFSSQVTGPCKKVYVSLCKWHVYVIVHTFIYFNIYHHCFPLFPATHTIIFPRYPDTVIKHIYYQTYNYNHHWSDLSTAKYSCCQDRSVNTILVINHWRADLIAICSLQLRSWRGTKFQGYYRGLYPQYVLGNMILPRTSSPSCNDMYY